MKRPLPKNVVAILLATTAALFARAWLQIRLAGDGTSFSLAGDLAYLAILPMLLLLALPVLADDRAFIRHQFRFSALSLRVMIFAVAAGVFLRLAWHAHIVAGISLGYYVAQSAKPTDVAVIVLDCPPAHLVAVTIVVYCLFIPVVEEVTYRAYVLSCFQRLGPAMSIIVSTAVFMVYHKMSGWAFVAVCGVILGTMYWLTRSLWAPVITHATINFLPQVTLRCLDVQWSPARDATQAWKPGLVSSVIALLSLVSLLACLAALRSRRGTITPALPRLKSVGHTLDDV